MPIIYRRKCDVCGKKYEGRGKRFCSIECRGLSKRNVPTWNKGIYGKELKKHYKHPNSFKGMLGRKQTKESNEKNRLTHLGKKNSQWKGRNIKHIDTARKRARHWYNKKPCEICGNSNSEIHHKDNNPLNNDIANIQWLCRKHHMRIDGRSKRVLANLKQFRR